MGWVECVMASISPCAWAAAAAGLSVVLADQNDFVNRHACYVSEQETSSDQNAILAEQKLMRKNSRSTWPYLTRRPGVRVRSWFI
jgi:hypothetical protein